MADDGSEAPPRGTDGGQRERRSDRGDRDHATADAAANHLENLRQRGEEALAARAAAGGGVGTSDDALEELRLHQAELEIQNEELRRAQQELEASRSRYYDLFDLAPVGYLQLHRTGLILQANLTGSLMLQLERRTLTRRQFSDFVIEEDRALLQRHLEQVLGSPTRHACDLRMRTESGHLFDAHIESVAPRGRLPHAEQCLCALVDVSELRRAERKLQVLMSELREANEKLSEMAHLDPLTGLLNRRGLDRVLAVEIARAKRSGHELFALLSDCDDFKSVNDAMGHAVGDTVLQEVARRLKAALRPSDQIARVGGDEFLVLLPETSRAAGLRVAERMRLAVSSSPVVHNAHPVNVTMSVGAVPIPTETVSIEQILTKAHKPLAQSKSSGKDSTSSDEFPIASPEDRAQRALARTLDFDDAVEDQKELGLHALMQPIRRLADNRVIAVELLSRTRLRTLEHPDDFFRVATQRGVLTTLDLVCLERCLQEVKNVPTQLRVHVNVFPSTIINTPAERLVSLFDGVDPNRICVEISEQQLIGDPAVLREPLRLLSESGVGVAMDDLGFGRTSLETLIMLDPETVKIDRRLVTGTAADVGRRRSLTRLLSMLKSLDVMVIAEGVEAEDDLRMLRELDVPAAQGFFLGRPAASLDDIQA